MTSDGIIDFCSDTQKALQEAFPAIWNSSLNQTPCRTYFCQDTIPYYLSSYQNSTTTPLPTKSLSNNGVMHMLIHQLCTKCDQTLNEQFDLFLNNNTCKWFDR